MKRESSSVLIALNLNRRNIHINGILDVFIKKKSLGNLQENERIANADEDLLSDAAKDAIIARLTEENERQKKLIAEFETKLLLSLKSQIVHRQQTKGVDGTSK